MFLTSPKSSSSSQTSLNIGFYTFFILITLSAVYFIINVVWNATTPVYFSSVWALCYFSNSVYLLFMFSVVSYLLPNLPQFVGAANSLRNSQFYTVEGQDLCKLLLTPTLLILLLHVTWSGPALTAWFGHIEFSGMQFKMTFLLFAFFMSYVFSLLMNTHFSSLNTYDFTLVTFNFFFWLWLTFFSNNLFTFIFFVELLSASITLLLVTSTFSSSHFYSTISYTKHSYFHFSTPTAFLQTLLFFFWITLVSSLLLFVFLILFYLQYFSFDWNLTDTLLIHLLSSASLYDLFSMSFTWLIILSCVFLKCGTVPFYFWKPSFFKGMSLTSLFFYVYVYYFSIFLYFIYMLFLYFNEFFIANVYVLVLLTVIATLGVSTLLFESFYLKSFLALSSILNSILIFLALCSYNTSEVLFLL